MGIERLAYIEAADKGVSLCDLDPVDFVELGAIDMVVCAMNMDASFDDEFKRRGMGLDKVLDGCYDLDSAISSILINTGQELVDNGNVTRWGERIIVMADNNYGTEETRNVNKRVKDFVTGAKDLFKIEISE